MFRTDLDKASENAVGNTELFHNIKSSMETELPHRHHSLEVFNLKTSPFTGRL